MKIVDFSETIEACDLKVGRHRQLNVFMEVCELKLKVIKVVYVQKFKQDFLRSYCANLTQFFYESFQVQGNENLMT